MFENNNSVSERLSGKKHAEEELRKSEELHRLTLSSVSDAVFITDDAGVFTYICPNAAVIFGYSPEEVRAFENIKRLLGQNLFSEDELIETGEIRNIEREVNDKEGNCHTVLINVKRVSIDGGTRLYTCRDITERKQAEESLRESEVRHSSVTKTITDAIITIDEGSTIVFVNPATEKLFGYAEAELMGSDLTMLMPASMRKRHESGISRYLQTGKKHMNWQSVELIGLHKNGQEIPLEISFSEFRIGGGSYFTGVARDISERRRAETKVQNLLEEVSRLYKLSRAIIETVEPETAALSIAEHVKDVFNVQYCVIFAQGKDGILHYDSPTAKGGACAGFVPSREVIDEVFLSGRPFVTHKQMRSSRIDCSETKVYYLPLKIDTTNIGVMVLITDILDRNAIDAIAGIVAISLERARLMQERGQVEALRKSDGLKSALLAAVSHDLRTPLTSIRTSVENLLFYDVEWNKADLRELHLIISEEVNRLTKLVENLLAMARIEAGQLRPLKEWGSVGEICENVLDRCSPATRNHQIKVECDETLPLVYVDARLIVEALTNLVENATKYSPPGSEITIRVRLQGDELLISVTDEGPGIASEEMGRIFDRFFRSGRAQEQQQFGTGMGLAIARGIIEAHGGRILVENEPGGAKFSLLLKMDNLVSGFQEGET